MKSSGNSLRHILHPKTYPPPTKVWQPSREKQAYFLGLKKGTKISPFHRNHKMFSIFITLPQKFIYK